MTLEEMPLKEMMVYIALTTPFVLLLELSVNVCVLFLSIFTKLLFPHAWSSAWFITFFGFVGACMYGITFVLVDWRFIR